MTLDTWKVQLEHYQGPLATLLRLIEEQQLEISMVNLGQVTGDFLKYLENLRLAVSKEDPAGGKGHTRILADFLVIASRLVLIKSKSLLPQFSLTREEQQDIEELEERLKMYQTLKTPMRYIVQLWGAGQRQYSRPYFAGVKGVLTSGTHHIFYPGMSTTRDALSQSLQSLLAVLTRTVYEEETIRDTIVSIEQEMRSVVARLEQLGVSAFSKLSSTRSKTEIVVLFLAILHLAKDQVILLEQERAFSDIMINHQPQQNTNTESSK